nr:MAG TPA: hypothetical protein [Caudoviricetes sp.]
MFFSIKYKENEEKYIKLFGNIKEKCYFCSRVEIFASRDSKSEHYLLLYNKEVQERTRESEHR